MPVYSKTGKLWSQNPSYQNLLTLDKVDLTKNNVVYYHHPYDELIEGVPLSECLDEINLNHLKTNKTVKLVHENDSETFDRSFALDVIKTIKNNNIDPSQLIVIVMDENHKDFLEKHVKGANIENLEIQVNNYLLKEIQVVNSKITPTKKFSSLSRNYRTWRLRFYTELLEKGILEKDFLYSFFNIWPYDDPPKVYSSEELITGLSSTGKQDISNTVKEWIESCPHELSSDNNVRNKWSNATYNAIMSSNIHVIIETHYDQKEFQTEKHYDRLFAPSSITEKAYKPIACKKPFIAFSTPYWLEDLKNLGFKTFHPYINEDYDRIENNLERLNMIVNEIERISNLDDKQFYKLIKRCNSIVEHNYNLLLEKKNAR